MARPSCTGRTRYHQSGSDAAARTGTWRPMRLQRIPTRAREVPPPACRLPVGAWQRYWAWGPPCPMRSCPMLPMAAAVCCCCIACCNSRYTRGGLWSTPTIPSSGGWPMVAPLGCIAPGAGPDTTVAVFCSVPPRYFHCSGIHDTARYLQSAHSEFHDFRYTQVDR